MLTARVGGDTDEVGDDVDYEGKLNEGSEGTHCALGGEYCYSLDGDG